MRGRILLVVGLAAGYVIGSRAGRKGYERLKRQASELLTSTPVQKGVTDAQKFVSDNVPVVGDKVADAIGMANDAATDAARRATTITQPPKSDSDSDSRS